MALDVNTAGIEFVKNVLSLYRSAKYFREKEVLAHKLLEHSIEAGRLTTELGVCPESGENELAHRALEELSKATFALRIMGEESIYPQRRIQPVKDYADKLKELINLYVTAEPAPAKAEPAEPAPAKSEPAESEPEKKEDGSEQPAATVIVHDEGGFSEVYTGKL